MKKSDCLRIEWPPLTKQRTEDEMQTPTKQPNFNLSSLVSTNNFATPSQKKEERKETSTSSINTKWTSFEADSKPLSPVKISPKNHQRERPHNVNQLQLPAAVSKKCKCTEKKKRSNCTKSKNWIAQSCAHTSTDTIDCGGK